jgi:hypothetical protein
VGQTLVEYIYYGTSQSEQSLYQMASSHDYLLRIDGRSSIMTVFPQYHTPYPESLGHKALWILGFSGFWIFMQRNFNTGKMSNNKYVLRHALSTIHNLFFMTSRKTSKFWCGIIFIILKNV